MRDKAPGGSEPRPEIGRKRKNDSHERIADALTAAYRNVEVEPLPDNLLDLLNQIQDPSPDKERS